MSKKGEKKVTFAPETKDENTVLGGLSARLTKDIQKSVRRPPPKNPKRPDIPIAYVVEPIIAFYIIAAARIIAALYSPIQDCDEVYNYWEPTHYLNHGYGFQTWEYSPLYAIRSWMYPGFHASIIGFGRWLFGAKASQFYFLRSFLGLVCAACETRLYAVICRTTSPRVGFIYVLISAVSTGMFHASVAYLPSSFTMYTTILGLSAFMDWQHGIRTAQGMAWTIGGAVLAWPFSAALAIPFIAEDLLPAFMGVGISESAIRLLDGFVRALIPIALEFCVDAFFYHKATVVPFNIVWYNVLNATSGGGPNIFGTEPWYFYILNLALNFNLWLPLAFLAHPLMLLGDRLVPTPIMLQTKFRNLLLTYGFYLWFTIFTLQPHKEERFMYPAYPLLVYNAAVSFHILLCFFGSHEPGTLLARIPPRLKLYMVSMAALLALDISVLRTLALVTSYRAPLQVYAPLRTPGMSRPGDTICLGKEWHRFPSHYLLPSGVRAKFIKSGFSGLMPGEFSEAKVGFGFFPGTWLEPPGMNDRNEGDPGKYIDISHCDFLVDSYYPLNPSTSELEPDYVKDEETWEKIHCEPFLDTASTNTLARTVWLPDHDLVPPRMRRKWGEYCLLKRRKSWNVQRS